MRRSPPSRCSRSSAPRTAQGLRAAYGVYLLADRAIWAPRSESAECDGLAYPPADGRAFDRFADAVVRSDRITALLDKRRRIAQEHAVRRRLCGVCRSPGDGASDGGAGRCRVHGVRNECAEPGYRAPRLFERTHRREFPRRGLRVHARRASPSTLRCRSPIQTSIRPMPFSATHESSTSGARRARSTSSCPTPGCPVRPTTPADASTASSTDSPTPRSAFRSTCMGRPRSRFRNSRAGEQDLIVGVSLRVSAPWGQYDSSRVVNIGSNRWAFKPEVGASKAVGPWTLEVTAAAVLFTDNDDFYGGSTRSQAPLYALQGHAIYSFRSGIWGSLDATYFSGGRTTIDGSPEPRSAAELACRRDAVVPGRPQQLGQGLREQRRLGAHGQQLRPARDRVAVPLGCRTLNRFRVNRLGARTGHRACARARTGSA